MTFPSTRFAECAHPWRPHVRDGYCAERAEAKGLKPPKEETMKLHDPWDPEHRRRRANQYYRENYEGEEPPKDPPWFLTFMIIVGMLVAYIITAIFAF